MSESCVVLSTCAKKDEATKIANDLVQARLAACVNLIPQITSIYRWEDKVEESHEVLMVIKTQSKLFQKVKEAISKKHSYACPEIISLPINQGSKDYLNWLFKNTSGL
jgi:periplasmic divalent cation tolerance protein